MDTTNRLILAFVYNICMKKSKLDKFSIQYEYDRTIREVRKSPLSDWFMRQQAKLNDKSS